MSEYNVVDNTELVELIERGLRKGYWDKALIPELKKRFKELENKTKLLELYRELAYHTRPIIIDDKYVELQQKIKELENE